MRNSTPLWNRLVRGYCMDVKGGIIINRKQIEEKKARMQQRNTDLPMDHYKISPISQEDTQKHVSVFRETDTIAELALKPSQNQVFAMETNRFMVNDVWFYGSVLLFPQQIFVWDVAQAQDIRAHSLEIVTLVKQRPRYVIIGTGSKKVHLHESTFSRLSEQGITYDVLPTWEAVSTFNVCSEDRLSVAAFLLPINT